MTPEPFLKGMDTDTYLRQHVEELSSTRVVSATLGACLAHDHPFKSLVNFASVSLNVFSRNYLPQLTRLPSQTFAPNLQQSYSPDKNTALLTDIIQREANSDQPFFAFTNYMDTHRPYQAPPDLQEKHLGRRLSRAEFERLNFDVAPPWDFVRLVQNDAVDDTDVETLKQLYAASIESVDRHLARLLEALGDADIREETMVVVLGDHGENLGESDEMGRRRFGHEASISDALARVPLVIDGAGGAKEITQYTSLKDLYGFLTAVSDPEQSIDALDIDRLTSDRVLCEYPALGDNSFYEEYPDIDRSYLRHRVEMDSVAVYQDDWRVVVESDGTELAFRRGNRTDSENAPSAVRDVARNACEQLAAISGANTTPETTARLKELGYL